MTTIRVQCETCKATLRVRDEGFMGEVHACPRCGSMVLIAGAAQAPPPAEPTESAAADAPPEPIALGLSQTLETLEAPPIEPPVEPPAPAPTSLEPPTPEQLETAEPAAAPASPSNLAPLLTTITALTATAVIGIAWLLGGPAEPSEEPVAQQQPPIEEATPADEAPPADPLPAPEPEPTPEPQPEEPVAPPPVVSDLPPVTPEPSEPPAERVASRDPLPPAARPPVTEPITREIDPLAFDPNQIDLALVGDAPPEAPAVETGLPTEPQPQTPPRVAPRAQARDGVFVRLGSVGDPPRQSADLALAQTLPRIELRDVPLAEACRLVGELAGAPVTLSPATLRRAGVRVDHPVNLVGKNQTLGELFAEALQSARLEYRTDGQHVAIVRKGIDQQRTVTHRLADLVGASPGELVARLRESVDAPLELSAAGDLPLTAPMRTHYDLLVVAEQLRLERGLPSASKYPVKLLAESPDAALGKALDRRTTFSFVEPTPLSDVFAYWRRVTGTEILVDWRALADAGLGPRSTITCSATNRPWRSALSGVLEPLGLTWRPAFGPVIAIAPLAPGQ